jgi:hypothetical protein
MEIGSKPIVESIIDSKLAVDGIIEEYWDRVVEFSHKGVDLDEILAPIARGFSWKEGVDLVEDFTLVSEGFEVHGKDTHVYSLLEALCGLLFELCTTSLVFQDG